MMAQSTDTILMIRPANFQANLNTAQSNAFQCKSEENQSREIHEKESIVQMNEVCYMNGHIIIKLVNIFIHNTNPALQQFDQWVKLLRENNVDVIIIDDTSVPKKPDAIFPNNWLSTHDSPGNQIITYPMFAANRRTEKRKDILEKLSRAFVVDKIFDLSENGLTEQQNKFLEGTGSMVLDRMNKKTYACLSSRTNIELLNKWCELTNYTLMSFNAVCKGIPVYHTNVILSIGTKYAVICSEVIQDFKERKLVIKSLKETGHFVVEISIDQMEHFAGNCLEVKSKDDKRFLCLSEQAYTNLNQMQKENLLTCVDGFLHSDISVIEKFGGGSARCMMCEIFLERKNEIE